jgi:hypothetical protein
MKPVMIKLRGELFMIKKFAIAAAAATLATGSALAAASDGVNPTAKKTELVRVAECSPCSAKQPSAVHCPYNFSLAAVNPCAAKNPCAAENPRAAENPCAAH